VPAGKIGKVQPLSQAQQFLDSQPRTKSVRAASAAASFQRAWTDCSPSPFQGYLDEGCRPRIRSILTDGERQETIQLSAYAAKGLKQPTMRTTWECPSPSQRAGDCLGLYE
jgi:hypothetical protein